MLGTQILVTGEPKGRFDEGIIVGTPKPGTVMEIVPATEPVGGRHSYQVATPGGDGQRTPVCVLLEDGEGQSYDDAYVAGNRARVYYPAPGEDVNVRVTASGTATSDSQAIGDKYIVESGTGLLLATTGSPESEPFMCMETLSDVVAAGTVTWCQATGQ